MNGFRFTVALGSILFGPLHHSASAQLVTALHQADSDVLQLGDSFELSQRRLDIEFSKHKEVSIWRCFIRDLSGLNLGPTPDFRSAVVLVFYSEEQKAGKVAIFPSDGQESSAGIVAELNRTSNGFDIADGSGGEYAQQTARALAEKAASRAPGKSSTPVTWQSILDTGCE